MRLSEAATISDLAAMARRRLPRFVFDFLDGGAGGERGVARNEERLQAILLKPSYGRGVAPDLGVRLFGRDWKLPIGVAPVGMAGLIWPGAELALARLAQAKGMPFVLSTAGTTPIEAIAAAAPDSAWFQLYASRQDAINRDLLRRAWESGIRVLVVTLDVVVPGNRPRDIRNRFVLPFRPGLAIAADLARCPAWSLATFKAGGPEFAVLAPYAGGGAPRSIGAFMGEQIKRDLTWDDVKALRDLWPGFLVVKGILAPADAVAARRAGADGVWVSNHGGRQLESVPASIDALPAVRAAVGPDLPLLMDGGLRSGEDVVKARLLGADLVMTARAFYYGVAAGGPAGGERAQTLLAEDLHRSLSHLGCPSFAALDRSWLWDPAAAGQNDR